MTFSDLAEHQIRKAQAEGQLDNLAGSGKPLDLSTGASTEAIGYRIMAEAGALPLEVALRKAVEAQLGVVRNMTAGDDRNREMKVLADLQLRLDLEQEARRRFWGR